MKSKYVADSVLTKEEILKIIAEFLLDNEKTQIQEIRNVVYNELRSRNIIGEVADRTTYYVANYDRRISDKDALLINECIYDLLYSRVITPGVNESNLELPFVHVSDKSKLNLLL